MNLWTGFLTILAFAAGATASIFIWNIFTTVQDLMVVDTMWYGLQLMKILFAIGCTLVIPLYVARSNLTLFSDEDY